jgi:hypothetical protein
MIQRANISHNLMIYYKQESAEKYKQGGTGDINEDHSCIPRVSRNISEFQIYSEICLKKAFCPASPIVKNENVL